MDPIAAAMRAAKARYPIVPDLRQEILVRSGIGRPCDHNSGHRRGRASQRGVIGCVIRSFSWIIRLGQRQFPKRIEGTNARAENLKQRCIADGHGPSSPDYFTCINVKTQYDMMLDMLIPGYALFH
jgi:hypothetical protein